MDLVIIDVWQLLGQHAQTSKYEREWRVVLREEG